MRYIDSGKRNREEALGSWLDLNVLNRKLLSLRWQSGFFNAEALGYFATALAHLRSTNGATHLLAGSNDGATQQAALAALLELAGPARSNLKIGVISFENAYFHPRTIHFGREDGSHAAYVGSANLTGSGVSALHIEAGLILDTLDGDDPAVLTAIARAIEWWFVEPRAGLNVISASADLQTLVSAGVLNVPQPPRVNRQITRGSSTQTQNAYLAKLVALPDLPLQRARSETRPPPRGSEQPPTRAPSITAQWAKQLSRSDAQRKATGNQRGSITLVRAGYTINAQSYFRRDLFSGADWTRETTNTGEPLETAVIPFEVTFLGRSLGELNIPVTYAPNREASQANYTTLLHLGPLGSRFARNDLTGNWLVLRRFDNGRLALSITDRTP